MALIIAVGFGANTDPFTCSATSKSGDNYNSVDGCLEILNREQFHHNTLQGLQSCIDEIIVVKNDEVICSFNYEDGLGA